MVKRVGIEQMIEWMNEWMNDWMNEWMGEWMNERRKKERKEELNEELNGCITKLQSWRNMDDTMRSSMSQKKNHWNKCVHE